MTIPPPPPTFNSNDHCAVSEIDPAGQLEPKATELPAQDPTERLNPAQAADLDQLATMWHDAEAGLEKHRTMKGDAEAGIRGHLRPGESWTIAGTGVGVKLKAPSRSFDLDLALSYLTPEELAQCTVRPAPVVDPAMVKAVLKRKGVDAMRPGTGRGTVDAT